MTGKGRPPTGQRVDVRIPAELVAKLDKHAAEIHRTRADVIRLVILSYYGYTKQEEPQP